MFLYSLPLPQLPSLLFDSVFTTVCIMKHCALVQIYDKESTFLQLRAL